MSIEQIGNTDSKMYLSIIGWTLVQKVEEGSAGAKKREYETSDWNKGVKWEISYKNLTGKITGMTFKDGDFGEQFILQLSDSDNNYQIAMTTDSRYFGDFAKKLPNLELEDEITLNPYDFTSKEGKQMRGLSIVQDWEKVTSAYWDGKKTLGGMPEVSKADAKTYTKDDWKIYFMAVKKFLKAEVATVTVIATAVTVSEAEDVFGEPEAPVSVEDLPF